MTTTDPPTTAELQPPEVCPSCGQPHTDDEVCRPEGAPTTAAVRCIHCGKEGTHRVCDECFKAPTTAAVSTFDEYLAKYRPDEFDRQRLAAMTPEERCREDFQRAVRDLTCYHCGALPDADGDHCCPCPKHDLDCTEHKR